MAVNGSSRWDVDALKAGAGVSLVSAVPFAIAARWAADSRHDDTLALWFSIGALIGFVVGAGCAAWVQRLDLPLSHGLVTAIGTYVAAQAVFITIKLLRGLTSPVKFLVFEKPENVGTFKPRLDEYQYQSKQVNVEYIDPDKKPIPAKEYEIQTYGTVVVEYMDRKERVTSATEQDLTGALVKVLNPTERRVYFLSGHGEKDPTDTERAGYSAIIDGLRRDN